MWRGWLCEQELFLPEEMTKAHKKAALKQFLVLIFVKHFQPAGAPRIHGSHHRKRLFPSGTGQVEFVQLKIIPGMETRLVSPPEKFNLCYSMWKSAFQTNFPPPSCSAAWAQPSVSSPALFEGFSCLQEKTGRCICLYSKEAERPASGNNEAELIRFEIYQDGLFSLHPAPWYHLPQHSKSSSGMFTEATNTPSQTAKPHSSLAAVPKQPPSDISPPTASGQPCSQTTLPSGMSARPRG